MQALLNLIIDIELQTVDHALHQAVAGEDEDFVTQVVAHADAVELEQGVHIPIPSHAAAHTAAPCVALDKHNRLAHIGALAGLLVQEAERHTDDG